MEEPSPHFQSFLSISHLAGEMLLRVLGLNSSEWQIGDPRKCSPPLVSSSDLSIFMDPPLMRSGSSLKGMAFLLPNALFSPSLVPNLLEDKHSSALLPPSTATPLSLSGDQVEAPQTLSIFCSQASEVAQFTIKYFL